MIEINLIPDVKQELLKAQRARAAVISGSVLISIAAVSVVVILSVYIFGVQVARGAILDNDIKKKGQELAQVEDLSKILTIQNQLATISQLNSEKIMASRVFDVVAAITPAGDSGPVSFSQISLAPGGGEDGSIEGGQIRLEGQTGGYDSMEAFKKRIQNTSFQYKDEDGEDRLVELASNINTSDISYGEDVSGGRVLRFTITFDYPAELLASATANQHISFKLTVNGNVTDSYQGIPRFTQRATDIQEGGN